MSKISFEPEGHALLVLAHRAHLLNKRIRTTDLTPLLDWLQAHHSLAGLTEHDALLLAEVLAWAIARTRAPLHALRAVAADAAGGNIRLDNGQRVAAVLREVGAVSSLLPDPRAVTTGYFLGSGGTVTISDRGRSESSMNVASLKQNLYEFAVELRQLAYTMPGGHEDPLVYLSERMVHCAMEQSVSQRQ